MFAPFYFARLISSFHLFHSLVLFLGCQSQTDIFLLLFDIPYNLLKGDQRQVLLVVELIYSFFRLVSLSNPHLNHRFLIFLFGIDRYGVDVVFTIDWLQEMDDVFLAGLVQYRQAFGLKLLLR